ncbi:sigma-70 family RNA polymerase sigma factor [candidate division FCPU426 bacterium]|nr:sigma-70 family RNA polymerase sigma factor [candidate division FCPU426 bacterium]
MSITQDGYPLADAFVNLPEKALVAQCQAGNLEAFNVLISRYENKVLNLTYRYLRDYHQALDETQEVFVKVYKHIGHFKGRSAFGTWLYAVTTNHCFSVLAGRKRTPSANRAFSLDEAQAGKMQALTCDPKAELPDRQMLAREQHRELQSAIAELPPDQQQAIILCHFEELTYEEIGEIMGAPVGRISSCIFRARQNLKRILMRKEEEQK